MFRIQRTYLILAVIIFLVEVYIALYVHDTFVRPYIGDVLVVILLYCFLKAFVHVSVQKAAIVVLLFSFLIEGLQYLKIVNKLGLQNSSIASAVIGTSFAWEDLLAYVAGMGIVIWVEKLR